MNSVFKILSSAKNLKPIQYIFIATLCLTNSATKPFNEKVLIITYSYNEPSFLVLQQKTFKKFLKDPYEFLVIDDAKDETMAKEIETTCNKLGLTHLRFPQHLHTDQYPTIRHTECIKFSLDQRAFDHDGIVIIIDSDMFLIKDLCARDYMAGNHLVALSQCRDHVHYISPAIVFIEDTATAPNKRTMDFRPGWIEGKPCDNGGHMYFYIKNNPSLKTWYFGNGGLQTSGLPKDPQKLKALGYSDPFIFYLEKGLRLGGMEFYSEYFLHYYAGSNWPGHSPVTVQQKKFAINGLLNDLTN